MSWSGAFVARVVTLTLWMTIGVFSQNNSSPSSAPGFMKVCSHENPPPCATSPLALHTRLPEYSKEARKLKIEGTVVLSAIVRRAGSTRYDRETLTLFFVGR
jgi:hypothetical protein